MLWMAVELDESRKNYEIVRRTRRAGVFGALTVFDPTVVLRVAMKKEIP